MKITRAIKFLIITIVCWCTQSAILFADTTTTTINQLPTTGKGLLYQDGKIYTVVGVLVIVLAGIALHLVRLEKKIGKLLNQQKNNQS